jgi:hypothetical protein
MQARPFIKVRILRDIALKELPQRTRALTFRPLFISRTWPEANKSATVATVSSLVLEYELTAAIKSPRLSGRVVTLRLFILSPYPVTYSVFTVACLVKIPQKARP